MARSKIGDLLAEDTEALVNTVNCVGVMGREIALQFKKTFPANFRAYAEACERGEARPGRMFVFETGELGNPRYIVNFPTKRHWRGKSRMEDIETGQAALAETIRERNIRSIALPPLGAGLGGLEWPEVRRRIDDAMRGLDNLDVVVFEPNGPPEARTVVRRREVPSMTPGRAALVGLTCRYLDGPLDTFVALLELRKPMYSMQIAGAPPRLKYTKASHGPYAENLRHVLNEIEGHFVHGYADGGDAPDKELELVPGAVEDAETFLAQDGETRERFERAADLVAGFESAFGLELLATVHRVLEREPVAGRDDLVARVHAWNERKKRFSSRQIHIAADVPGRKGRVGNPIAGEAGA